MAKDLDDSQIQVISRVFEMNLSQIQTTLQKQDKVFDEKFSDLNKRMEKSDLHFDKRIDDLERKIEEKSKKIEDTSVKVVRLETSAESSIKRSSALISGVVGVLMAIATTLLQKLLGLS